MLILVINSGSSSLKYKLVDIANEKVVCKGICEKIGLPEGIVNYQTEKCDISVPMELATHTVALAKTMEMIINGENAVLGDISQITAIGHRVAHGGELFLQSAIIDSDALQKIESLSPLAPLHTPAIVQGIRSSLALFGENVPNVAVFDTTFHAQMPRHAYLYPLPYEYYEEHRVRRFGFHGTSHKYVAEQAAVFMGKPLDSLKIVTCHLGNGSSITAVKNGVSIDTSMGFTPIAGVVMGTRCGDLDVGIATYLQEKLGVSAGELNSILNKKSGLFGVSGVSSDMRDIETAAENGNERAQIALEILAYSIKKYIGAYVAAMNGIDALVFTGGIGENSSFVRKNVCDELDYLGIDIDEGVNNARFKTNSDISTSGARVRTLVIPTDEEMMIARDTANLVDA